MGKTPRYKEIGAGVFFRVPKIQITEKGQCNNEFWLQTETGSPVDEKPLGKCQ